MTRRPTIEARTARTVTVGGRELLSFAGCDYLGLAHDPRVVAEAQRILSISGISSSASRETSGNHVEHERLEQALADFLGVESALLCTDGYLADLAALQSATGQIPVALIDADAHPSLVDAARASGCELYEYGQGDWRQAKARLAELPDTTAILTDAAFPLSGRVAPLAELLAILPDEGLLVVDESHSLGVLGPQGRGAAHAAGLGDRRLLVTASLSKGIGCAGGVVAGSAERIALVREHADAYVGATPISPALAGAARVALEIILQEPERLERLLAGAARLHAIGERFGFGVSPSSMPVRGLEPANAEAGMALAHQLLDAGIFCPFVCYPGDPGAGVLRFAVNAEHRPGDLERLAVVLSENLT